MKKEQSKLKSSKFEEFKTLRINLQFSNLDNKDSAVLVTSSAPNEGKSTVCTNLTLAIGEADQKVLLIDCDLRRPSIHKKFKISNGMGLSNMLAGQKEFEEVVQKYNDNTYILTAGTIPPNPSELVSSNKMKLFLEEVRVKFDHVILDTPPVMSASDAQALATMVQGVILVISSGQAEVPEVKKALELLRLVKANVLGVVLNKVKPNKKMYRYVYDKNDEVKNSKGRRKSTHKEEVTV
jgi:capsular exopolysaccharide synthesis family protein